VAHGLCAADGLASRRDNDDDHGRGQVAVHGFGVGGFVVDAGVTAGELEGVVREAAGPLLEDLRLFDVYTGEQVAEGRKSLAFALRLRGEATLTAEETARVRKRVLKAARKAFGAELRA